jgi:hypothetical protein
MLSICGPNILFSTHVHHQIFFLGKKGLVFQGQAMFLVGGTKTFAYELTLKPLNTIFTDCPTVFWIE